MILRVTNLANFGVGISTGFTIANTANSSQTSNAGEFTFLALSFGDAVTNRLIAITVEFRSQGRTMASATIGGVSATLETVSTEGSHSAQIIWAVVPSGLTGNVIITTAAGDFRNVSISVYRIVGQSSSTPNAVDIGGGSNVASPTVDFASPPSNGVAIYCFVCDATDEDPGSWTNSVTENVDMDVEDEHVSSAHFGPGSVPDSAFERDSNPGVDQWGRAAVAGAAWS